MADDLRITFEMELDHIEGQVPTGRLRMMWEFAMNLIEHLQAMIEPVTTAPEEDDRFKACDLDTSGQDTQHP